MRKTVQEVVRSRWPVLVLPQLGEEGGHFVIHPRLTLIACANSLEEKRNAYALALPVAFD